VGGERPGLDGTGRQKGQNRENGNNGKQFTKHKHLLSGGPNRPRHHDPDGAAGGKRATFWAVFCALRRRMRLEKKKAWKAEAPEVTPGLLGVEVP
jgi:hypothetical protein